MSYLDRKNAELEKIAKGLKKSLEEEIARYNSRLKQAEWEKISYEELGQALLELDFSYSGKDVCDAHLYTRKTDGKTLLIPKYKPQKSGHKKWYAKPLKIIAFIYGLLSSLFILIYVLAESGFLGNASKQLAFIISIAVNLGSLLLSIGTPIVVVVILSIPLVFFFILIWLSDKSTIGDLIDVADFGTGPVFKLIRGTYRTISKYTSDFEYIDREFEEKKSEMEGNYSKIQEYLEQQYYTVMNQKRQEIRQQHKQNIATQIR